MPRHNVNVEEVACQVFLPWQALVNLSQLKLEHEPQGDFTMDQDQYNTAADPDSHADHQFCTDMSCPCHEDPDKIGLLESFRQEGEVSIDDANRIFRGQTF